MPLKEVFSEYDEVHVDLVYFNYFNYYWPLKETCSDLLVDLVYAIKLVDKQVTLLR